MVVATVLRWVSRTIHLVVAIQLERMSIGCSMERLLIAMMAVQMSMRTQLRYAILLILMKIATAFPTTRIQRLPTLLPIMQMQMGMRTPIKMSQTEVVMVGRTVAIFSYIHMSQVMFWMPRVFLLRMMQQRTRFVSVPKVLVPTIAGSPMNFPLLVRRIRRAQGQPFWAAI